MGCWLSQRWSAAEKVAGDIERSRDLLGCGGGVEPDVAGAASSVKLIVSGSMFFLSWRMSWISVS